jgi:hypothetical protein
MHVDPRGLFMAERVYGRDNRTIRLAGMIHIGEKNYYDDLVGSIAGRTIVLAEGVSDDANRLQEKLDYGRVADFLGLTSQEKMPFRGRLMDASELDTPRPEPPGGNGQESLQQADILRADLDISDFRPPTILFLDAMGKHLQESPSFGKGVLSLKSWAGKNITPAMNEIIMDDILHRRNKEVLRHLSKALDRYDTVVIPWGALHMKEIEAEVLNRGFELREERERISIDFGKVLLSIW